MPGEVNAIIEIPAQSFPVKYEADKRLGVLRINRIMSASLRYPQNYGFIPQTIALDGSHWTSWLSLRIRLSGCRSSHAVPSVCST